jgi:cob(I)alamin adenosyltransferase
VKQVQIYTGLGKGKTTAALGLSLRFLGSGGSVRFLQFDKGAKEGSDFYSERKLLQSLKGISHQAFGLVRFDEASKSFRFKNLPGDFEEAKKGLDSAFGALGQNFGLLVLDEILSLPLTGLAERSQIMDLLDAYEKLGRPCELLLTGHDFWPELEARADLVTEMRKVKHYFDKKVEARKGIEY